MKNNGNVDELLVSVIVPAYNSEQYIKKTLGSILRQTYDNFEVIIINDASVDNTLKVIEEYKKINEKIKIINLKENKGVSNARNTGIKEAKGKYFIFIDSDDFISENFLKKLIEKALFDNILPRCFDFSVDKIYEKNEYLSKIAYGECLGTSCGYLINKEKCKNIFFNENITHMEDTDYITQVIARYEKVEEVSEGIYTYVDNKDSATRKINEPNIILKKYFNSIDIICNRLNNIGIVLDMNKINNRKFLLLKNMLKQSSGNNIIDLLEDSENSGILKEKNNFVFKIYKSIFGKMYFIIRSVIKYNILKK